MGQEMVMSMFAAINALIVDPVQHSGHLLRTLLASLGVKKIENARTTEQSLFALRLHRYDVIFFDETGGNQSCFVNAVRGDAHGRNAIVPVILVSAGLQQAQITDARVAGMHDVIVKPVSAATLERKLQALLAATQQFESGP
jgi:two-component system chemotaxis response regulator CheY